MSDALPLPPRPNLDYYRALARDLQHAASRGDVEPWAARWVRNLTDRLSADPSVTSADSATAVATAADTIGWPSISAAASWVTRTWVTFTDTHLKKNATSPTRTDVQFFLARLHGFESWPRFADHVRTLSEAQSMTAAFEAAADAIVGGDLAGLRTRLDAHAGLVHRRSTRDHHSTLLHYVSANGIEDFRQKTPPNIVAIAELLLDRGADVNAESDAYGGHSTALGLTATSAHPEQAGVQIALLELLLARGAHLEQRDEAGSGPGAVSGCLANGQGRAARFLAGRGAALDLVGAAGVDRADIVATYFDAENRLIHGATAQDLTRAVLYAAGYGAEEALRALLAHGASPNGRDERLPVWADQTPLHWATFGPHVGVARQLLAAGATVDARDRRWQATPLDWALHAWAQEWTETQRERGYGLIEELVAAGATTDLSGQDEQTRIAIQGDARLRSILTGAA